MQNDVLGMNNPAVGFYNTGLRLQQTSSYGVKIKHNSLNFMLDIETYGTTPDSVIRSIGCVAFSPQGIVDEFYRVLSEDQSGRVIQKETYNWWKSQPEEAQAAFRVENKETLQEALLLLSEFISGASRGYSNTVSGVWGCGSDFDNVIVAHAYRQLGIDMPWKFWENRCYRTMKSLAPKLKIQRQGVFHNALDDAKSQALHLLQIVKTLNLKI